MLFYSFFKTLVGKEIVVELKNGAKATTSCIHALHSRPLPSRNLHCLLADLAIRGTLHSVDQFLNIKLLNVSVEDAENFPHMVGNLTPSQTGLYVG
jgi:U6 snRNA-associated Sm-like protein LSm2|eukprot:Transcript_6601.p3 GENE.Transcript_6601~~Transcript_6601.p3  ORF type:complete len:96 (+),score=12.47 Transcript_6601:39-326(+)